MHMPEDPSLICWSYKEAFFLSVVSYCVLEVYRPLDEQDSRSFLCIMLYTCDNSRIEIHRSDS
ncbi:hypothetical protein KDA_73270 [Dictyobacter alpinus]|uniref:Uncharacterized protein n=1 Tax=Dictyobacter alpinus TaxID=2014873 RepID=A0A402BKF6_9CHLR|nr:hypothetical protein KDA_73270 [Dictyobacter alpinus]